MKKYRILKIEYDNSVKYCIQKRFLFFWWIGLDSTGEYEDWFSSTSSTYYYQTLENARAAINMFNPKKTVIEEL